MQVSELGRGGFTPQCPRWASGLAKRGPAALTQMGGTTRQPGDPVGLCLGSCCRVGFLFLGWFLVFFLNSRDLVLVCELTLVFGTDIRQRSSSRISSHLLRKAALHPTHTACLQAMRMFA